MAIFKNFKGGINTGHTKNTRNSVTVHMNIPSKVLIPMLQHIGAPCNPLVKKGDYVKVGQKIGDCEAYVSSPVHSSVSGTVTDVRPYPYPGGIAVQAVEIEADGRQEMFEGIKISECTDRHSILKALRESGAVGLGGAGFPTHVKLAPPKDRKIDYLVVNGAECEPYITSDFREMLENTDEIIDGICIVKNVLAAEKAFLCIENNKPEAIKLFKEKLTASADIEIISLKTLYPQGAEKQLIYSAVKRKVPSGGLPSDAGIVVQNINTLSFISRYFKTGIPLISKRVTVDGTAVAKPANVMVPIGTPLGDVFDFCGGFKEKPAKIIMGGPMMGVAQYSLDMSILKQTNALLAFDEKSSRIEEESVCLRCGRCVQACPMNLLPLYINISVLKGDLESVNAFNANDCIECGCCSYECPAKRHLVQSIRLAKAQLRNYNKGGK